MATPEARAAPRRAGPDPARGLQRRLMLAFALFALCLVLLFSLYALAFAYSVEDRYLEEGMAAEAARQRAHHARRGGWIPPLDPGTRLIEDPAQFPDDLRADFAREPQRSEFAGAEGRHYHVLALDTGGRRAWLVAEVGERLIFRRMRGEVAAILGWSGAAALALALLLGAAIARRTTRSLSRLADAVAALHPEQLPASPWLQPATGAPRDEVDVLARGLDDLVQRIRAFLQREQDFTRDVSHELRTPLSVIRNLSEQVARDPTLSSLRRGQLEGIRQSTVQLEQTVSTLLALARETHLNEAAASTPVLPVLERVLLEQTALYSCTALELQVDVSPDARVAFASSVLHLLLSNLIGNALAHAEPPPDAERVTLHIDQHRSRLRIRNRSRHAPVDADFAPFRKREGSPGAGLGLAIVRRLCDRFDIDLRIEHTDGITSASIALADDAPDADPPARR